MFRNYLTMTIRNLIRNKLYAAINIGGLAVGFAASILILLFVQNELTYDTFWQDAERIYRLEITINVPGRTPEKRGTSMAGAKNLLDQNSQGITNVTRIRVADELTIKIGDKQFVEEVSFSDRSLFDIFNIQFLEGSPNTALENPNNMIMTESLARKYFGEQPALGQSVILNPGIERTYKIVGIIEDFPENTHFKYLDIIVPFDVNYISSFLSTQPRNIEDLWTYFSVLTYIQLAPGVEKQEVLESFSNIFDRHVPDRLTQGGSLRGSEVLQPSLINISDIHLNGGKTDAVKPTGNIAVILSLPVIAGLILLTAGFNFINLSTAQATKRSREVGLRKVFGASRKQIIQQNLGETFFVVGLSLIGALGLVKLIMPWFNEFLFKVIESDFLDPLTVLGLIIIILTMTVLSGAYPAFFLSSFKPLKVLNANSPSDGGPSFFRSSLVVLQFSIAITLMISTVIVFKQTSYSTEMSLGFNKENVLVLRKTRAPNVSPIVVKTMMERIRQHPDVLSVTRSQYVPGDGSSVGGGIEFSRNGVTEELALESMQVDYGFFKTYEIPLLAGRPFSSEFQTDALLYGSMENPASFASVIINESTMRVLGFDNPEDTLGSSLHFVSGNSDMRIIGVVPDIIQRSARDATTPFVYYVDESNLGSMSIRLKEGQTTSFLSFIDSLWAELVPEAVLQLEFLDERIAGQYFAEKQQGTLLGIFSLLAIFLSGLGLYGLAFFTAERRTKEIGMRKVLGASFSDIIKLVVWQFSKPVIIANLIAWPVAWYFMNDWLSGFAYRIDLNLLYFAGAGLLALLIAWVTVAGHAWRVARTNPVRALRYE